jgi:hypothetical protein
MGGLELTEVDCNLIRALNSQKKLEAVIPCHIADTLSTS